MYLKSIQAYGFKSFADKTKIVFGENINGIVGPNGSGKSNVVDAVRWVLGEQSIKSLRGESSTDVIFSGSKSRKPLNSASVTLVFDNSDLALPVSYSEVSIKRIMYRSGESEYFLNNERCRLKDITNILTDSGADKESFNIIGQGKIDEILSTKPGERRSVFESAAGILKYRKRKEEALKKLERTNTNINRVDDIITELKNNLEPLSSQKKIALEYLNLKEKLTELEVALMVYDIETFNHQTKELTKEINRLQDEITSLSNTKTNYDIDILTKKDEIKNKDQEINKNQTTLLEITKSISKIDADMKVLKERKKYLNQENNLENKVIDLKENLLKLETYYNELQLEITNLETTSSSYQEKRNNIKSMEDKLKSKLQEIKGKFTQQTKEKLDLEYQIEYLENSLETSGRLPKGIKSILNNQRFTGAHNVIGNLLKVDNEYSLAIANVLGASSNYLVVDSRDDAKEMIAYLKEHHLGRVTFFPLDVIESRKITASTISELSSISGYIGIASDLVSYDLKYKNIIENQLGNVIVALDMNSALAISSRINRRYRIVTLDGQLIHVGGSITGGSSTSSTGILLEKRNLEEKKMLLASIEKDLSNQNTEIDEINLKIQELQNQYQENQSESFQIDAMITNKKKSMDEYRMKIEEAKQEISDMNILQNENSMDSKLENMINMYYSATMSRDNILSEIEKCQKEKTQLEEDLTELEQLSKSDEDYMKSNDKKLQQLEIKLNTSNIKLDRLLVDLTEEYNLTYQAARDKYFLEIDEKTARELVNSYKNRIKEMGYVNVDSVKEYDKVKERYDFLTHQKEDLLEAEAVLNGIIHDMDKVMAEKFKKTFESIRVEFKKVFREMFGGGNAELLLTDPDNLLETGIEIEAVPSGKNLKSISLLSGGEKTFTAISLLFAILNVRPVPFCLLDEVEAALDDANVESFGNYLNKYRDKTQFILITHKKKTMEFADILYGITMQESGVSKMVSVKLEDEVKKN